MLRFLTCAAAIFVLVLSMCLLPQTAAARRCGVKEPETLLSLYQNSDGIYVATFDKTVEGEAVEDTEDYTAVEVKKHFTISSTLKGRSRKFFVLEEKDYRYKTQNVVGMEAGQPDAESAAEPETETAAETETDEEPEEETEDESELKSGDTLLLFTAKGGEGEPETLADYRDGIKKLSMEHIAAYEARIRELNAIFSSKKVNAERLLAWVIRTAEDPVTRWEGTYELLSSVRNSEWREEAAKRRKEQIERGELIEEMSYESDEPPDEAGAKEKQFDASVFARMLNHDHKQTIANILLNSYTPSSEPQKAEMVKGDDELIELVKRWGDPRLIGFLLDQLRTGSDGNAVFNADAMSTVAEILDDDDAIAIAEKYSSNSYEDGNELVEAEEEEAEDPEPVVETPETQDGEKAPIEPEAEKTGESPEEPAEAEETEEPVKKLVTYSQLRTELMQKFLAQCDKAIADKEKEKHERSAR